MKPDRIYYVATRRHLYTVTSHLEEWGSALAGLLIPISYDELFERLADRDWWDDPGDAPWSDAGSTPTISTV